MANRLPPIKLVNPSALHVRYQGRPLMVGKVATLAPLPDKKPIPTWLHELHGTQHHLTTDSPSGWEAELVHDLLAIGVVSAMHVAVDEQNRVTGVLVTPLNRLRDEGTRLNQDGRDRYQLRLDRWYVVPLAHYKRPAFTPRGWIREADGRWLVLERSRQPGRAAYRPSRTAADYERDLNDPTLTAEQRQRMEAQHRLEASGRCPAELDGSPCVKCQQNAEKPLPPRLCIACGQPNHSGLMLACSPCSMGEASAVPPFYAAPAATRSPADVAAILERHGAVSARWARLTESSARDDAPEVRTGRQPGNPPDATRPRLFE
jgi:hypothetical protein